MIILGIDFTSAPRRPKPITCLHCTLADGVLRAGAMEEWSRFDAFEQALRRPGPWIAGLDFPFGQARRFIETVGWPRDWAAYVAHAHALGKDGFVKELRDYSAGRPKGDREHRRATDVAARSQSPQKLFGVPVGRMFFQGAPRLMASGVTIPHLQAGDPGRIAVEAYPGVLARQVIGNRPYKNDSRKKQTAEQHAARRDLLGGILDGALEARFGFRVEAELSLCDDPGADRLDALLCAMQAAWAWQNRESGYGAPADLDPLEGWIADPTLA